MNRTKIEWVKNPDGTQGYTLNSKTGCFNHTLDGLCLGGLFPCYAFKLANGRLKQRYLANTKGLRSDLFRYADTDPNSPKRLEAIRAVNDPFYPRFWEERLREPYRVKKSVGIFLDDMSDWMGNYWPEEWTQQELQMMRDNPQHRIYTLTKQPQNLIKFSPFPDNCFIGVTVTTWDKLMEARFALHDIQAKVKFISFEPLLSEMRHLDCLELDINWLIIGAQTRPQKQPEPSWVNTILNACDIAKVPVFMKNNLAWQYHRQEMPEC